MLRAVPRHNVNLTADELRLVVQGALGQVDAPDGLNTFEAEARRYFGAAHAIAVESGRTALHLALYGLGLRPGATVVLPRYCFFSLVKVVEGMGCKPLYAPIDPDTFGLDPRQLEPFLKNADALVVIHPFGQLAKMDQISALCKTHGVPVVEDASQATGARSGRVRAGSIGDVGVFSLVSGKNLQTFGGGLLLTQRDDVARLVNNRLKPLSTPDKCDIQNAFRSGLQRWFLTTPVGFRGLMFPITRILDTVAPNTLEALTYEERRDYDANQSIRRLSDIQGLLGVMELAELDRRNSHRRANALRLLDRVKGTHGIKLPVFDASCENSFNAVAIRTSWSKELAHRLRKSGFDTRTDYMEWFGAEKDFEEGVLYLPNHPGMSSDDIDALAQAVRSAMHPV